MTPTDPRIATIREALMIGWDRRPHPMKDVESALTALESLASSVEQESANAEPFGSATSAELFATLGSADPEKDERELNAVIRRMDIKSVPTQESAWRDVRRAALEEAAQLLESKAANCDRQSTLGCEMDAFAEDHRRSAQAIRALIDTLPKPEGAK